MTISPTVNFDDIAARTEGFSGADLQALLYNCHLDVIHRSIQDAPTPEMESKDNEEVPVKYFAIGGSGNKPLRSKAEETALQRRVCDDYDSLCSSAYSLSCKLRQVLQNSSSQQKRQEEAKTSSHKGVCTILFERIRICFIYLLPQNQIQQKDILKALKTTKPSVSVEEQYRLGRMYV